MIEVWSHGDNLIFIFERVVWSEGVLESSVLDYILRTCAANGYEVLGTDRLVTTGEFAHPDAVVVKTRRCTGQGRRSA